MNQVIALMSPQEVEATRTIVAAEIEPMMSADVSSYARGRRRAWLGPEPRLGARRGSNAAQGYYPGPWNTHAAVEAFCRRIWRRFLPEEPPLGPILVTSGTQGISPHRDASYARPIALTINLGDALWLHNAERHSQQHDSLTEMRLTGGEILAFDCKHIHACRPAPDRLAIHLWSSTFPTPVILQKER